MKTMQGSILLFTTACLAVFGALYGAQRWKERPQISAEAPPAGRPRPSSSFPSGCGYFQQDYQEFLLRSLASQAAALPVDRCMHGPVSQVFGEEFFREVVVDRWGREFFVDCHPGPQLVRVFSFGPDGKKNTDDDIGQAYPWVPRSAEAFRELMRESVGGLPSAPAASSPAP